MSHHDFRFKKFIIRQDRCAMKVGTDGVLLGSWVHPPENISRILDIGTGTGLIALMMAQKSSAIVDAIDIDAEATRQANDNFRISAWSGRLNSIHESLQQFASHTPHRYDLIVSNPPFFMGAHPAPSEARNIARHMDETLSIWELSDCVKKLLKPGGAFSLILPFKEGMMFLEYAEQHGLYANHLTKVKTKVEKQEKRLLMNFGIEKKPIVEEELVIQDEDMSYTKQYVELTSDFYLGLPKSRN